MQRTYHQNASDAYSVKVVSARRLDRAKQLFLRRDGARGAEVAIYLSPGSMVFEPSGLKGSEVLLGDSMPGAAATLRGAGSNAHCRVDHEPGDQRGCPFSPVVAALAEFSATNVAASPPFQPSSSPT